MSTGSEGLQRGDVGLVQPGEFGREERGVTVGSGSLRKRHGLCLLGNPVRRPDRQSPEMTEYS
jgi:hypothetical protein